MKIEFTDQHWIFISEQKYITLEIVQQYRFLPWNFIAFTKNSNITYDIIKKTNDIPWSYKHIDNNGKKSPTAIFIPKDNIQKIVSTSYAKLKNSYHGNPFYFDNKENKTTVRNRVVN